MPDPHASDSAIDHPKFEAWAQRIEGIWLRVNAEDPEIAAVETSTGGPAPSTVRACLQELPKSGARVLDPEGHSAHSGALAQLLAAIDRDFVPAGVLAPTADDRAEGRDWWYLVFQALPGVGRFAVWDDHLILRPSTGEEAIARSEAEHEIALPASYRHLLRVFSQVLHNTLYLHEGTVGPDAGACTKGFQRELGYIEECIEAAGEFAEASAEELRHYLPFYADPYGNEYLFRRRDPGAVFMFEHETCGILTTDYSDFDAFFAALLTGGVQ